MYVFLFVLHERVLIHFVCYQAGCDVVFSEAEPQVPGTQEPRLDRGGDEISLEMAANPPVLGSPTPVEDSGAGNVVSTGRSTPEDELSEHGDDAGNVPTHGGRPGSQANSTGVHTPHDEDQTSQSPAVMVCHELPCTYPPKHFSLTTAGGDHCAAGRLYYSAIGPRYNDWAYCWEAWHEEILQAGRRK